jgi:hypothetical protein
MKEITQVRKNVRLISMSIAWLILLAVFIIFPLNGWVSWNIFGFVIVAICLNNAGVCLNKWSAEMRGK